MNVIKRTCLTKTYTYTHTSELWQDVCSAFLINFILAKKRKQLPNVTLANSATLTMGTCLKPAVPAASRQWLFHVHIEMHSVSHHAQLPGSPIVFGWGFALGLKKPTTHQKHRTFVKNQKWRTFGLQDLGKPELVTSHNCNFMSSVPSPASWHLPNDLSLHHSDASHSFST